MNCLELSAAIIERNVLRYSPAGIAILDFTVQHASQQIEAGQYRQIELELKCLAIGDLANRLQQVPMDQSYRFKGFLARRSRNSKTTIFHATSFELNE